MVLSRNIDDWREKNSHNKNEWKKKATIHWYDTDDDNKLNWALAAQEKIK